MRCRPPGTEKKLRGWCIAVAHAVVSPLLMALTALLKSRQTLPGLTPGPQFPTVVVHSSGILAYLRVLDVRISTLTTPRG